MNTKFNTIFNTFFGHPITEIQRPRLNQSSISLPAELHLPPPLASATAVAAPLSLPHCRRRRSPSFTLHPSSSSSSRCRTALLSILIVISSSLCQVLESLPLPNIKWICPTAPTGPVALLGGFPYTTWFDVADISKDNPDDFEGLDALAAHIANLLSAEPADGDEVVHYTFGEKSAQTS